MNYILLTPVKNEETLLPNVADCIIRQTIRPVLWVIIDGNSSDQSLKIAENLASNYDWIQVKKQETFSSSGGHTNFSLGMDEAYHFAIDVAARNGIEYSYVGKIDADQILPENFFEYLMQACNNEKRLGVVSGKAWTYLKSGPLDINTIPEKALKEDKYPEDELPDKRLYRKAALDDIGGFPVTKYSPDTVALAKLRMKGWEIKSFPEVRIINLRKDTGIESNNWKSAIRFGKARYYLGYHPLLLLLGCGYILMDRDILMACGLFFGYWMSWAKGEEVIADREIWHYFRHKRIKELLHQYMDFRKTP